MHFYVHWSILIIRKKDVSWNLSEKETTGFSRSPKGQKNENWKLSELTKWGVLLNKQVEISRNLKNYPNSINIDHAMTENAKTGSVHITRVISIDFIRTFFRNFLRSFSLAIIILVVIVFSTIEKPEVVHFEMSKNASFLRFYRI